MVLDDALGMINRLFTGSRRAIAEKRFGQSIEKEFLYKMAAFSCG